MTRKLKLEGSGTLIGKENELIQQYNILDEIQGDTGLQGITGIQDVTGLIGSTGAGSQGTTGVGLGYTGIQGVTGFVGSQGETGLAGSGSGSGLTQEIELTAEQLSDQLPVTFIDAPAAGFYTKLQRVEASLSVSTTPYPSSPTLQVGFASDYFLNIPNFLARADGYRGSYGVLNQTMENAVLYALPSNTFFWNRVGANFCSGSGSMRPSLAFNGSIPYVATLTSTNVGVYSWDGSIWSQVGANIAGNQAPSIAFNGSIPYVALAYSNQVKVYSFDGSVWSQVGANVGTSYNAATLAFNGSTPYVAFRESSGGQLQVHSFDGSVWSQVGTNVAAMDQMAPEFAFAGSTPYVAYITGYNQVQVMSFNGSVWSQVGAGIFFSGMGGISLAFNGIIPYIATPMSAQIQVMSFNGSVWSQVGAYLGNSRPSLAFNDSTPYMACRGSTNKFQVYSFNGSVWSQVGIDFAATSSSGPSLVFNGTTPYIAVNNDADVQYQLYSPGHFDTTATLKAYYETVML